MRGPNEPLGGSHGWEPSQELLNSGSIAAGRNPHFPMLAGTFAIKDAIFAPRMFRGFNHQG